MTDHEPTRTPDTPAGGGGDRRSDPPAKDAGARIPASFASHDELRIWLGMIHAIAEHGADDSYDKALTKLRTIADEVTRLLAEVTFTGDIPGPKATAQQRFDWLLNAPFEQRLRWLREAPVEHRVEWIFDRTIDPVGAPIDQTQLIPLLRDIEQQAHEAHQAGNDRMRTALAEIWLQLEYLIPLIQPDSE